MKDFSEPNVDEADDAAVRLLRMAGPRETVSAARESRVKSAVHAEWQARTRRRSARRRVIFVSAVLAAASVVAVIVRFNQIDRRAVPLGEAVAVVEQIDGSPSLSRNDPIRVGEWVTTDAQARVALRFSDGTSVRLDAGSRARALSSTAIELAAGAVYVDTERESGRFEVQTAMATARDIGTQFEVRVIDRALRLRVRTGVVELTDRRRSVSGRAGTEITLTDSGAASRPILPHGPEWDWTARVSPPIDMEGMSTAAFLERVAREHGWVVQYADPALAQEASRIVLHGSVTGLAPPDMISSAIAASGLQHRFTSETLLVLRTAQTQEGAGER
jgi:hypothetical protein